MKPENISDALEFLDDDILAETELLRQKQQRKRKRYRFIKLASMAACIGLIITAVGNLYFTKNRYHLLRGWPILYRSDKGKNPIAETSNTENTITDILAEENTEKGTLTGDTGDKSELNKTPDTQVLSDPTKVIPTEGNIQEAEIEPDSSVEIPCMEGLSEINGDYPTEIIYSQGITLEWKKEAPSALKEQNISEPCLTWMEPEEIFALDTVIFRGTVEGFQYYRISRGYDEWNWFSVASVKIQEVYRGDDMQEGDIYNIYLPLIPGILTRSDSGELNSLTVGSEAIFMPYKATKETGIKEKETYFCYADVAEFYFSEGERFLFLETENGVSYAKSVYPIPHESDQVSLEDVCAYILQMIK